MTDSTHQPHASRHVPAVAARIAWVVVVIVLASGVVGALNRGLKDRPDWQDLSRETRFVWEHGHAAPGTAMFGYLPTTTFALWPFTTWLPRPLGLILFVSTNLLAAGLSIWLICRWWPRGQASRAICVWPVLLACANLQHALQANQISLWVLALCVAGLTCLGARRDLTAGVLIGLAALLKVTAGVLLLPLLLRGRWKALVGVLLAGLVFDILPSAAFFGWDGGLVEHRAWLERAEWHSNRNLIEQPLLRVHRQIGGNESLAAVLARWLRALPDADQQVVLCGSPPPEVVERCRAALRPNECLTLDPMPRGDQLWAEERVDISFVPRLHVADLSATVVWWLWATPVTLGLLVLSWSTWRTGRRGGNDWTELGALWMLMMFWPSPMVRHYYLAWAAPAIVIVWAALTTTIRQRPRRWTPGPVVAIAALVAWLIGVICLGWWLARWYGLHLGVLALLTAAAAWGWRRSLRRAQRPAE